MLLCIASGANGQSFQEGFMLKDYKLVYRYNPALASQSDFLGLFQSSIVRRNDVGASAFIYPYNGQIVTFLNSRISADAFSANVQKDNYLTKSLDFNLFSYGLFRKGATHTFEVNIRGMYAVSAPGSIFMLAKTGTTSDAYDFSRLRAQGDIYAELAYGYSRKVSDVFSFGGRVKLLCGFYGVDYNVTRLDLSVSENIYKADIEAEMDLTDQSLDFGTGSDGLVDFKDFVYKGLFHNPTGGGLAIDLGIAVNPTDNLTLSASVLDLGGILWHFGNASYSTGTVTFAGLKDLAYEDFNKEGLMSQINDIKDDALAQLKLRRAEKKLRFKQLPFSANLGAKYSMPFYESLSLGLTGQYIGYQWMPYLEGRFAVACNPVEWFDCTANIGTGSYGMVWGAATSIHIRRFRLNAGIQNGFEGYMPRWRIPVEANYNTVTMGLTYDL